jgi:DNA-binding XRE family transcriptional regulator
MPFKNTTEALKAFAQLPPQEREKLWKNTLIKRTKRKSVTNCLEWDGNPTKQGYGRYKWNGIGFQAHRFVYMLHYGVLDSESIVSQTCNNKMCVELSHLTAKSTHTPRVPDEKKISGSKHHFFKITDEIIQKIKESKENKALTQEQRAKLCGVSARTVRRVDNGELEIREEDPSAQPTD